jgi:hypothetical protein
MAAPYSFAAPASQVARLTESLKALTAVFKRVKGDDDIMHVRLPRLPTGTSVAAFACVSFCACVQVSELREVAARLERRLADRTKELEVSRRPLW